MTEGLTDNNNETTNKEKKQMSNIDELRTRSDVKATEASTIRTLTDGGYTPESVVAAVQADGDWSKLVHTGNHPVNLIPPSSR